MKITFLPTEDNVKVIGRTIMCDDVRLLCCSGSGVEFKYLGSKLTVTFYGDSSVVNPEGYVNWRDIARVQVLVDGRIMLDTTIKKDKESFVVYGEDPSLGFEEHTVRIVKLSEPRMSSVALGEIQIEAERNPEPTPEKYMYVEFIGDSITCGYGVDTDDELCPFSTGTENARKAYAYLAAEALDVDYSLVSYSGHGFVSGWTPNPDCPQKAELIQPYYDIVAYSYNSYGQLKPQDKSWDFKRIPDVIVINIGTNDYSYTQHDANKIAEYEACYIDFLKMVRKRNTSSHIICSLGVMGDDLFPAIEHMMNVYLEETGDTNISGFKFAVQNPEADGYSADYHPSAVTQQKAAAQMIEELKRWL